MFVRLIAGIKIILDCSFSWLNSIPFHEWVLIYLFSHSRTLSFLSCAHAWLSKAVRIPLRNASKFPYPPTVNGRAQRHPGLQDPRLSCLSYSVMPLIFKVSSSWLWKDIFGFLLSMSLPCQSSRENQRDLSEVAFNSELLDFVFKAINQKQHQQRKMSRHK